MPPRSSLTSSFSITDANNEVVCPLRNQDGSSCRKRCIGVSCLLLPASTPLPSALLPAGSFCRARGNHGLRRADHNAQQEKRYRSMQEHIRRAHPEHYISKLPATEESFLLMISTPPSERPQNQPNAGGQPHVSQPKGLPHAYRRDESSAPGTPRHLEEYSGAALYPAAAALAQLHNHKSEPGWDSEGVSSHFVYTPARPLLKSRRTGIQTTKEEEGRDLQSSFHQYTSTMPT